MEATTTLPKTLLVTNDYPPRVGGIQRTLEALWKELPPERVSVLAPMWEGAASFDAAAPYRIVREPTEFIWPTPAFAARLDEVVAAHGVEVVLFGDAFPLALLGPRLARRGTPYLVAAHGFDYWLSIVPGAHASLRYMTSSASRVPVMCSEFIARTVRTAVPRRVPVSILYPGADLQAFRPDLPTADLRERLGVGDRPLVVCVSRLVARKGQDVLIVAMRRIRERVPQATLVIVGGGPYEERLRALAADAPAGSVLFAGQVSEEDLPRYYALGDVFAMPCRTRLGGMEVEGWGNVFIEASACCASDRRRRFRRRPRDARPRRDGPARRRRRRRAGRRRRLGAARRSGSRPADGGGGASTGGARARVAGDRRPSRRVVARRRRLGELHRSGTWCGVRSRHGRDAIDPRRRTLRQVRRGALRGRSLVRDVLRTGRIAERPRSCGGARSGAGRGAARARDGARDGSAGTGTDGIVTRTARRVRPGARGHDHRGAGAARMAVCGLRHPESHRARTSARRAARRSRR